jgi:transcriptional regulator with XRE-family HTH domain
MAMAAPEPRRRLIQLRVDMGLSRHAAARRIGITGYTLRQMEEGALTVRVASVKRAADFYGVPVSELAPDLLDPRTAAAAA